MGRKWKDCIVPGSRFILLLQSATADISKAASQHIYIYIMTPWGLAKPSDIWAPDIELFTFLTFLLFIYLAV